FLEAAGVDAQRLGPGVPAFSTGWICTESSGVQIVEREVYTAKTELKTLMSELNLLSAVLVKNPQSVTEIRKMVMDMRLGEDSFFWEEWPVAMDTQLRARFLPIGEHSILNKTRSEIRSMPERDRRNLAYRIERFFLPSLQNEVNSERFPWSDDIMFGWVREKFLP
ncbi:MAG: hypothetical protein DRO99_03195, partial [Candidatus Aenigmatarchaeota archaeon]